MPVLHAMDNSLRLVYFIANTYPHDWMPFQNQQWLYMFPHCILTVFSITCHKAITLSVHDQTNTLPPKPPTNLSKLNSCSCQSTINHLGIHLYPASNKVIPLYPYNQCIHLGVFFWHWDYNSSPVLENLSVKGCRNGTALASALQLP